MLKEPTNIAYMVTSLSTPNRTMFITGASRGIGAATAVAAAADGWNIAVGYRSNADAAAAVVSECRNAAVLAEAIAVDVRDETAVKAAFAAAAQLGPVRSVINNAGVIDQICRLDEMSVERMQTIVDVNVVGALIVAREAVIAMSTRHGGPGGTIVNVGSAAAYLGSANEFVDYAASKGAIDTLTIGLARELATEDVRVNCVRPGLIDTEIHADAGFAGRVDALAGNIPMQRGGTAAEVADLIMYLAGDQSSYVTGSIVNVSGGR